MLLGGGYEGSREEIINCETELNLRLNVSELYGAFNNISQVMSLSENGESRAVTEYLSNFRAGKHDFANVTTNQFGVSIASVLNIYGCLPAIASKSEGDTKDYDLFTEPDDVYNLVTGNAHAMNGSDLSNMYAFYTEMESDFAWITSSPSINKTIEDNLKYRFPVVAKDSANKYAIIIGSNNGYNFYKYDDKFDESKIAGVIDTYSYLLEIANGTSIKDEYIGNNVFYDKISFNVPKTLV